MSKATIWNYLKQRTELSDEAIAGIMGNFEAESNCEPCRLQGDFTADRSKSKAYAQATMAGTNNFVRDSQGWGLAQWTYWSRKQNLLSCCQSYGVNIDDETAQLEFFLVEMQTEYVGAWRQLLGTKDIYTAAKIVCEQYEKPAVCNTQARANFGQQIYNQYHGKDVTPDPAPAPAGDNITQAIKLIRQALDLLVNSSLKGGG